jgi:glycosyltransferase involved in cell wall biosynthesis
MSTADDRASDVTDAPAVQVCFASYNTAEVTELCVRTLCGRAGTDFELLVGDCGSTDGSIPMLEELRDAGWLRLEIAPGGRKHPEWLDGWLATSTARYVVFCDSDIEFFADGWLAAMVDRARTSGAALVATRIQARGGVDYRHPVTGARATLAARPEPWLLLIDVEQVRGTITTSFAYTETVAADGAKTAYDTAAMFFHDLDAAGLPWVEMPADFARAYRHYGSMTWQKLDAAAMPLPRRLKQLSKLVVVKARVRLARRRFPSPPAGRTRPDR